MGEIDLGDYRSGGYFLMTPTPEECASRTELPPDCIPHSVSFGMAQFFPDSWGFDWAANERERSTVARELGWPQERIIRVQEWVNANPQQFDFPNVFLSHAAMAEFARTFIDPDQPVAWIGIGLHVAFVEEYLQARRPTGNQGTPGVYQALSGRQPLHAGGQVRGFDVLHFEYSTFDSWLWKSLHIGFAESSGQGLNSYGLLDDAWTARAAAVWSMHDEYDTSDPDPDPHWWLPWVVVDYTPPGQTA
ncbi:MAG TPA: hypothetical protein VD886_18135 [Herpetosiphonaceae bacterium]|nr:hypothetical protein [Herpetosiphonaceae bacterium]